MVKTTQNNRICRPGRIRRSKTIQLYFIFIALIFIFAGLASYNSYYRRPDYSSNIFHTGQRSSEKQKNVLNSPGYSIKLSETKDDLLSSLNLNSSLLHDINQGNLFAINPISEQSWRKPLTHDGLSKLLTPSLNRKKVTTYINKKRFSGIALDNELKIIEVWKRAMWVFGFDPILLDFSHASSHELYPAFKSNELIESERKQKYEHVFAWAKAGAGLYVDYHFLPIQWPRPSQTTAISNNTDVDFTITDLISQNITNPTIYNPYGIRMVQANQKDADQIASKLAAGQSNENIESVFTSVNSTDTFAEYSEHYVSTMLNGQENMLNGEENINEGAVAEMMETHMHQTFLKRYIHGGIVVVHAMEDEAEIVSYPMKALANRLAQCPMSKFASTCPPTSQNIKEVVSLKGGPEEILKKGFFICGNPCAPDSPYLYGEEPKMALEVHEAASLPRNDSALALIAVPHPVTALSLLEKKDDVTCSDARSYLIRDSFIRQVTSLFLPANSVGMSYRLLLCKDSIYQGIQYSNAFWTVWEKFTTRSKAQLEKHVSYEFGFRLPDKGRDDQLEEATDVDEVSEAVVVSSGRNRALSVYGDKKSVDKDLAAIESWNAADTELWLFLDEWIDKKRKAIDRM